jgi:mannobiose 2-epimerase
MSRPATAIRRTLKRVLDPSGSGGLRDRAALAFWSGYGRACGARLRPFRSPADAPARAVEPGGECVAVSADYFLTHLRTCLLPFWARHSIDRSFGGYLLHLDRRGRLYAEERKLAGMQARMIYAFALGHRVDPEGGWLALAKPGIEFLLERFWDREHGGWFLSVERDGQVASTEKHLFHQAYVLAALAEFHDLTGDASLLPYIARTLELIERHAWDPRHGGFVESCRRDWTLLERRKTACVQLDMLFALLAIGRVCGRGRLCPRLSDVADIVSTRMRDPVHGSLLEVFRNGWTYSPAATRDRLQTGHNLKAAWLLLAAHEVTGDPVHADAARRLVGFCLRHAWCRTGGGFVHDLFRNGRLAGVRHLWWTECEGLLALLAVHRHTGDESFLSLFRQLAAFIDTRFVDREHGEWFTSCDSSGAILDDRKGGTYRAAYHPVQACYEAWRALAV